MKIGVMNTPPLKARFCLAVIRNPRNEVLLLRRSADDDFAPGLWGFPGGHLRGGESPEAAMQRELREELGEGLLLQMRRRVGPVRDTWYGGVYAVYLFLFEWIRGEPCLNREHQSLAWVAAGNYREYAVVDGVDEDLAYLRVWPVAHLHADKLPEHLKPPSS